MNPENVIGKTYEKYAEDMNAHADQCATCDAVRKTSTTHGVCDEGRKLVDAWKAFIKSFTMDEESADVPKD